MQLLKSILHQARQIWDDSTGAARLGIALMAIIFLVTVIAVGVWSSQPSYVVLVKDLTPAQASQVRDALILADIEYKVEGSGSIVKVDNRMWADAKVAIGKAGVEATESTDEYANFWDQPSVQDDKLRRNKEKRLALTIERIKGVKSAKVNLGQPRKNSFIRNSPPSKASVMLELVPGGDFDESTAFSVAQMVAHSVTDLSVEQVVVTDEEGNHYGTDTSGRNLSKQEEFKLKSEQASARKIISLLGRIYQPENISVAVTHRMTFQEGEMIEVAYDDGVVQNELETESTTGNAASKPEGVVGAAANQGRGIQGTVRGTENGSSTITKDNTYLVPKTEIRRKLQPILDSMSVAVAVNKSAFPEGADFAAETERIKTMVRSAVSLETDRDMLSVDIAEFPELPELVDPVASSIPWEQIYQILERISLGLAALVAFFIALRAFKKFSPEPVQIGTSPPVTAHVDRLADMVKENPEVFSQIIASWSELDPETERESTLQVRNA